MSLKIDTLSGPALVALGELAGEVASARQAAGDSVTEVTAGWVAPHYLLTLQAELAERPEGAARLKLLRQAAGDVATLQRGSAWAARLQMDRERLEFQRQKHRDLLEVAKQTAAKLAEAGGKKRDLNEPMTEAELKACVDKVDEIFGLK